MKGNRLKGPLNDDTLLWALRLAFFVPLIIPRVLFSQHFVFFSKCFIVYLHVERLF